MGKRFEQLQAMIGGAADPVMVAERVTRQHGPGAGMALMKAACRPPAGTGPALVQVAPARGHMVAFQPVAMFQRGDGAIEARPDSFDGRRVTRRGDAFDRMQEHADRAARLAGRRRVLLFTPGQIDIGREYQALVERHRAAGVKLSSIEGRMGGSGDGGAFIVSVLRDRERIDDLRRKIGNGTALSLRRIRPSARGSRRAITDRALVDMVCLEERTITEVISAHGWKKCGSTIVAARAALVAALERMRG